MAQRVIASDLSSIVVGYALFVGGSILLYLGLERFLEKRSTQIHNFVLLVVFIFADIYFVVIAPNLGAHIASISLAILLIFAQSAWLAFRRADAEMRSISSGVGVVYSVSCLINLTRILVFVIMSPDNDFFGSNAYEASQLLLSQAIIIALAFSLLMMVNRRLVASLERGIAEHEQAETALHASETLFHQMFTEHSAMKLLLDPENGNIVDANPAAGQFYGYPIETLLRINTMTSAEIETAMQDARQHKRNYFVFQHRLASGELRDVEIYSTPIQVNDRQLLHSIIHDVTERKRMEEALQVSQLLAEELYESAPDALITVNSAGRITRVNSQALATFGYAREKLLNQPVEMLIPPYLHEKHEQNRREYFIRPRVREMGTGLELSALKKGWQRVSSRD